MREDPNTWLHSNMQTNLDEFSILPIREFLTRKSENIPKMIAIVNH